MTIKDLNQNFIYEVKSERLEDDGRVEEAVRCFDYEQAKSEAESIDLSVGFSAVIYKLYLPDDLTEEELEEEFEDAEDIFDRYCQDMEVEFYEHVRTEEGNNIEGAVVIKWQWNKYVGYSRNFEGVGIAGKYPYHNILKEIDLITGDEDRVFRTNYSLLATKKELEEYGEDILLRKMIEGDWRWNNVEDVSNIMSRFVKEELKYYTDRAMFNRIYQGYSVGNMIDEEGSITHTEFESIWTSRVYVTEEYRDDLRKLIEKDIITTDIVEDMLELDSQSAMDKLNKIKEKYER